MVMLTSLSLYAAVELDTDSDGYIDKGYMPLDESWTFTAGITLGADSDFGDYDIASIDKLAGYDSGVYIDMGTDGTVEIESDTLITVEAPNIRFRVDTAAYLNVATADAGATTISTTSDGTDRINIGDGSDRVDIASDTTDMTDGVIDIKDDTDFHIGSDDDAQIAWDSASARLEFRNSSDTPIVWIDFANVSLGVAATAIPEMSLFTSSAAGSARADEYACSMSGTMSTQTEDAETSDINFWNMISGTKSLFIEVDGSDEAIILGDSVSGEDLKFDFETAADNQVEVSSNSGATEISLSALQLVTTGDIMGAINVSSQAGAYTVGTDDASEAYGTMFTNSNVADITLAGTVAVVGASGCLMQEAGVTGIMQLEPGTGSHLGYQGVEMADGTPLASAGAATDRICWVGINSDHWLITSSTGTWAE